MKTAVIVFGFLRTYETTAFGFMKNVLKPNEADLLIFAPNVTGYTTNLKEKYHNNDAYLGEEITESKLQNLYSPNLKYYRLYKYDEKKIQTKFDYSKIPQIADIHPMRVASMFYHIKKSLELLEEYEKLNNIRYDNICLTRADLAFYSELNFSKLNPEVINVASGKAFTKDTGKPIRGAANVFFYKNVKEGFAIPGDTYHFADQIIYSKRDNIMRLKNLYDEFDNYMAKKMPCNPETLLFYELCLKPNVELEFSIDCLFEIFRPNMRLIENINNLTGYVKYRTLPSKDFKIINHPIKWKLGIILRYKFFNKAKYDKLKAYAQEVKKRYAK